MRWMGVWCFVALLACETDKGVGGGFDGSGTPGEDGSPGAKDDVAEGLDMHGGGDSQGEGDSGVSPDVGSPGDAVADAGGLDSGGADAVSDGGATDAGAPSDSGAGGGGDPDTGAQDAISDAGGPQDAGPIDAGDPQDAGPTDAGGPQDAGPFDAGGPVDAGPADTGPPPADPWGLRITEIMYDPAAVNDDGGEWFEVLNTGTKAVDLVGVTIGDNATKHLVAAPSPLMVAPGAHVVIGRSADPAKNGGISPLYVQTAFSLTNTADSVVLSYGGVEIDRVDYDEAAGWPNAAGFSVQLDPDKADTWCGSTKPFGAGDLGTPGAKNHACGAPPVTGDPFKLVITEIMYDPAAVGDTAGEWVELTNTGAKEVDLRGLTFSDAGASALIDAPSPLLVPAGGRALLGRSKDPAVNGGVTVLWTFGFSLNNDKDSVLLAKDGVEIDRVDYDEGAGWPAAVGASLQLDAALDPATANNALPAAWCLSTAAAPSGDLGTPGAANTACGAPGGPCVGHCDGEVAALGCWCDAACVSSGDCCADACETCGYCGGTGACTGSCGGQSPQGCWCDSFCVANGDCCADACATCGVCP